jgi:hypothetical protein
MNGHLLGWAGVARLYASGIVPEYLSELPAEACSVGKIVPGGLLIFAIVGTTIHAAIRTHLNRAGLWLRH